MICVCPVENDSVKNKNKNQVMRVVLIVRCYHNDKKKQTPLNRSELSAMRCDPKYNLNMFFRRLGVVLTPFKLDRVK